MSARTAVVGAGATDRAARAARRRTASWARRCAAGSRTCGWWRASRWVRRVRIGRALHPAPRRRSSAPTASATRATATAWVKVPQIGSVRIGGDVEIGCQHHHRPRRDGRHRDRGRRQARQPDPDRPQRVIGAHTAIAACVGHRRQHAHRQALHDRRRHWHQRPHHDRRRRRHHRIWHDHPRRWTSRASIPASYPVEEARQWRRIVGRLKRIESMAARLAALEAAAGIAEAPQQEDNND